MAMNRPLEGLLRPPLEWYTSTVSLVAAGLVTAAPAPFLMSSSLADFTATGFLLFAGWRFKQGLRIWRYQRNLKRMPTYTLSSKALPVSQKQLFLGKGFWWTAQHTQRLRDLDLDYNLSFARPSALFQLARRLEFAAEHRPYLCKLAALLKKDSPLNPVRPYPAIGGTPCLHGVADQEQAITLSLTERAGHMVVIGATGVGKTRFAEILIAQDIRRGDVVIVLDPKGDADLLKRVIVEAQLAGREQEVLVFHLGFPQFSCRYNGIGYFTKITQVATRISNALPSTGEAAAFKEFAWKYVNLTARGLMALGICPTYQLISFYITKLDQLLLRYFTEVIQHKEPDYTQWRNALIANETKVTKKGEIIEPSEKQIALAYVAHRTEQRNQSGAATLQNDLLTDLAAACQLDSTYYNKITASIGPLLEKLTSGEVASVLSPNYQDLSDERPILDWLSVIRQKKIVYVGMDALTDQVICSAVGNAMLSDLVSVAGHLYNFGLDHGFQGLSPTKTPLPRICLHSDEFNEVIGNEFIPLLNKARGAGFNVVAYTQTWSDVEARLGSTAKAGQVAGNFNTLVMFRTKEMKTVDMLIGQLPKVPILRVIPASSSSDSPHGQEGVFYQSSNEDRLAHTDRPLIEQTDVANLPKGQAFTLQEGGKLGKIRVPLPTADDHLALPATLTHLLQQMQQRQIQGLRSPS